MGTKIALAVMVAGCLVAATALAQRDPWDAEDNDPALGSQPGLTQAAPTPTLLTPPDKSSASDPFPDPFAERQSDPFADPFANPLARQPRTSARDDNGAQPQDQPKDDLLQR